MKSRASGPSEKATRLQPEWYVTIRIDRNCMLIGLPASGEEARKWEELLRTYARYLILKAINMDRESKGDTDE